MTTDARDHLSGKERLVYDWLVSHHAGVDHAAPRAAIIERYNHYKIKDSDKVTDREFRQICSDLVVHFYKPICTTSSGGYYVARYHTELDGAANELDSRAVALLDRAKALRKTLPLEPQAPLF